MQTRNMMMGIVVGSLAAIGVATLAQETAPTPAVPEPEPTRVRIMAPFNLLADLTDSQKVKIEQIHKQELEQEKKLQAKEHDDIVAVLSDAQKKELELAVAKNAAEKKATAEERRAKELQDRATQLRANATQPSK